MFGVLAINKPTGMTSRDVVNRVQRLIRPVKVGHTGTLDPMATGVLLVAVGPATRLVEFSHEMPKSYEAEFILGNRSDTLDVEGQVVKLSNPRIPSLGQIENVVQRWIGHVKQIPPKYSAISIGGRRAYDLARSGKEFDLKARTVEIHSLEITGYEYPSLAIAVCCGTGTYIRSLGSDIAQALATDAVMSRLVRTNIGPIQLTDCVPLGELSSLAAIETALRPAQTLLDGMPKVIITDQGCQHIRNGIVISCDELRTPAWDRVAAFDSNQQLVAILKKQEDATYRSLRVFQKASETPQPSSIRTPQSPES